MRKVLIDNWSIEEFVNQIESNDPSNYDSKYFGILEALLLWDEVYYPLNSRSVAWKHIAEEVDDLYGLEAILKPMKIHPGEDTTALFLKLYPEMESLTVGQSAVYYASESSKNGLDYYPCRQRVGFLEETKIYDRIRTFNLRKQALDLFNKEIDSTVDKYLSDYSGFGNSFDFPYISDYLLHESQGSPLTYTIERRNNADVRQLRGIFDNIEESLNRGHVGAIIGYKRDIEEIVSDITRGRKLPSGSIGIMPSISLNFDVNEIVTSRRHTFLRKVAKYAMRP